VAGGVVGQAWYELGTRDANLRAGVNAAEAQLRSAGRAGETAFGAPVQRAMDDTGKAGTRLGGTMGALTQKTGGFGSVFKNLGAGILQGVGIGAFMGVTVAAGALVGGISSAIESASNLNETISKTQVVFGEASPAILKWGETSATAFGMSKNAALGAAAQYGNLFVSLGLAEQESADMSRSLVELAGDLASFNNVDPTEALDALRSGLVGETEPLRRFGVNLNDATLRQKALELGLISSVKEGLTPAVKAQASYALILDQTKTAQGDFARTSDGLANQQRIASARLEDAMARIGSAILPVAGKLVPMLADAFIGILDVIGDVIAAVQAWLDENKLLVDILGTLAQFSIGMLISMLQYLANIVSWAFGVFGDVVSAVASIVRPILEAIIGTIRNVMDVAAEIPGPWQDSAKTMRDTLRSMEEDAKHWGEKTTGEAKDTPPEAAAAIKSGVGYMEDAADGTLKAPMINAATEGRQDSVKEAAKTPRQIADALIDGQFDVGEAADSLKEVQKNALSKTKEIAKIEAFLTGDALAKGLNSKKPAVRAEAEAWKKEAEDRLFALRNNVPEIARRTGRDYATVLGEQKQKVADETNKLHEAARNELRRLTAHGQATAIGKDIGGDFSGGIGSKHGSTTTQAGKLRSAARDELTGLPAKTWGGAIGEAWARGIATKRSFLADMIQTFLGPVVKWLQGFSPPREGPLRFIDRWAANIAGAFAEGFAGERSTLEAAVAEFLRGARMPAMMPALGLAFSGAQASFLIVHEIRDPSRSLASIGTTPEAVAQALAQGFDATALLRNVRHVASLPSSTVG
jgi:hypothetical protein